MKKIMFNSKLGLEQAVLEGRKTQTRRIIKFNAVDDGYAEKDLFPICNNRIEPCLIDKYSNYKVGEIVAIAQSYKDCGYSEHVSDICKDKDGKIILPISKSKGWTNKMFTKSSLMVHKIRITNVRIERLQDISWEDCLAEGLHADIDPMNPICNIFSFDGANQWYFHPREAYAALIDKVSGKGTWQNNPYVFVYDFKLVK